MRITEDGWLLPLLLILAGCVWDDDDSDASLALRATLASATQVALTWSAGGDAPPEWQIERSADGSDFTVVAVLPGDVSAWTDDGLVGGSRFHYRVRGAGVMSNIASVTTAWARSYDLGQDEDALSVEPAPDGGFIVAGEVFRPATVDYNAWAIKLDAQGEVEWEIELGTPGGPEWFNSMIPTSDGGYIGAGLTDETGGGGEAWIVKLTADGAVAWHKSYDSSLSPWSYDELYDVKQMPDGGYVAVGVATINDASDLWVLKLDAAGNVLWQKTYGGIQPDGPVLEAPFGTFTLGLELTADGGFLLATTTQSFGAGIHNAWVLKLDDAGNVQWQQTYGDAGGVAHATCCRQTSDGGYAVVGSTGGSPDVLLLRLASNGEIVWQRTYGGAGLDIAHWIEITSDGGFIVSGRTDSFGAGSEDLWVLKLDAAGDIVWQQAYGGPSSEFAYSTRIREVGDGGFVVAGRSDSTGQPPGDVWVLKIARDGTVGFSGISGFFATATSAVPVTTSLTASPTAVVPANGALVPVASTASPAATAATVVTQAP